MTLKDKFKKFYKGNGKIVKTKQGDDNLIAVLFYNPSSKNYDVGVYRYGKNVDGKTTFNFLEIEEHLNKLESINKFNQIVREF